MSVISPSFVVFMDTEDTFPNSLEVHGASGREGGREELGDGN